MGLQVSSRPVLTPESTAINLDGTSTVSNVQDPTILLISNAQTETKEGSEIKENDVVNNEEENETTVLSEEENVFEGCNYWISTRVNISEPLYDPEEEKADLYLVQKRKSDNELEDLFLIITSDDIKERDALSGKLKYCWSTNSVLSCVLGRSEPVTVDIIFDTTREERQNRRYYVEPDERFFNYTSM